MSKRIYFEVTGKKLKTQMVDWLNKGCEIRKARYRFSRRVGASRTTFVVFDSVFGHSSFGLTFNKDPDPKVWRYVKSNGRGPGYWTPRLANKDGKKLSEQMKKLRTLSTSEMSKLVKLEVFKGMYARAVNMWLVGERLLLAMPEDYKPIRGIKRISDLAFERLTA